MFCCFDVFGGPHKAYNGQTSDGGVSNFPGQRNFQSTRGNALTAAPPPFQHQQPYQPNGGDMIAVTIPHGVHAGQTIQVNSPDGRTAFAQVPQGMGPGSQFMVSIPPRTVTPPPSLVVQSHDYSNIQPMAPPSSAPFVPSSGAHAVVPANKATVEEASPPSSVPFVQATPLMTTSATMAIPVAERVLAPQPPPQRQNLLRVQVPPGMQPGSTVHVQVPGENRMIAAQIPPGVSEFHVAYESQTVPTAQPPPQPGQTLLLVRVPPGTPPGTVLHVSIPGEPGRVIGATVPPNASEFHVSYVPGSNGNNNNNNNYNSNNNNGNNRGYGNSNNNNNNNNQSNSNQGYNNNNNNRGFENNQRSGGGVGSVILPLLGGAALGAAGMGIYGAAHNQEQQQQAYNGDDVYQDNYGGYDNNNNNGGYDHDNYGGGDDDYGGGGGDDYGGGDW